MATTPLFLDVASRLRTLKTLAALLAGAIGLILPAQTLQGQPARVPAPTQRPQVPWSCGDPVWTGLLCPPDDGLELALEREYWDFIGRSDVPGMRAWVSKAERYTQGSGTRRAARFTTLITAGLLFVYRAYDLDDPRGLPFVLRALWQANQAHALAPDAPNVGSFYYFLRAYVDFAFGRWDSGMEKVDELLGFPARYGALGSEGEVVGALALGLLRERAQVERSLEILDDCRTFNCQRTSSLAPFKAVGMHLAIAEAQAKLGRFEEMEVSLAEARAAGTKLGWPYMERIDALEEELLRPGGLIDAWSTSSEALGSIQLPLPPSARLEACSTCHVGAVIPAGIYPRRPSARPDVELHLR